MKNPVKSLALITISNLCFSYAQAQMKLPVFNGFGNDIKKVIEDYPGHFFNLAGGILAENPGSTDYACNFQVHGAEETIITRFSGNEKICSWQARMLTTENFEKAKQKFRSLFSQLNNLTMNMRNGKKLRLKGIYESPSDVKKFVSVLFSNESEEMKKMKVELSLQFFEPAEWKITVAIFDREREDNERGKTTEGSR